MWVDAAPMGLGEHYGEVRLLYTCRSSGAGTVRTTGIASRPLFHRIRRPAYALVGARQLWEGGVGLGLIPIGNRGFYKQHTLLIHSKSTGWRENRKKVKNLPSVEPSLDLVRPNGVSVIEFCDVPEPPMTLLVVEWSIVEWAPKMKATAPRPRPSGSRSSC